MAFNGTRATAHWRVLYPKVFFDDNARPMRSIILINANIPTNQYVQIQFNTPDMTGLILTTGNHKIVIINIYNDCTNNGALDEVSEFLSTTYPDDFVPDDTHIFICGDFKCHHPWWETEENEHLTSAEHAVRLLLNPISRFDL